MAVSITSKKEIAIMAFREWTLQKLEDTFQLIRQREYHQLSNWLEMDYVISDIENQRYWSIDASCHTLFTVDLFYVSKEA